MLKNMRHLSSLLFLITRATLAMASSTTAHPIVVQNILPYHLALSLDSEPKEGVDRYLLRAPVKIGNSHFEFWLKKGGVVKLQKTHDQVTLKAFASDALELNSSSKTNWIEINSQKLIYNNTQEATYEYNIWAEPEYNNWSTSVEIYPSGNLKQLLRPYYLKTDLGLKPEVTLQGMKCGLDGSRPELSLSDDGVVDGCSFELASGETRNLFAPFGQRIQLSCTSRTSCNDFSLQFYPNGTLRAAQVDYGATSHFNAYIKAIGGSKLHHVINRAGTLLRFDSSGRLLQGWLDNEPIASGNPFAELSGWVEYNVNHYEIFRSALRFKTLKNGFIFNHTDRLDEYCVRHGGLYFNDEDSNRLTHEVVYGTKEFFDIATEQWVNITDRPIDYLKTLNCEAKSGEIKLQ